MIPRPSAAAPRARRILRTATTVVAGTVALAAAALLLILALKEDPSPAAALSVTASMGAGRTAPTGVRSVRTPAAGAPAGARGGRGPTAFAAAAPLPALRNQRPPAGGIPHRPGAAGPRALLSGICAAAAVLVAAAAAHRRSRLRPVPLVVMASATSLQTSAAPTAGAGGLRDRGLHRDQVPVSVREAAAYRSVALPEYVPGHTYGAAVVGGGPAGLALAINLARRGASVVVVDTALAKDWPNNYGVWLDEWEPLGFPASTLGVRWDTTVIRYTAAEATRLPRGYGRVDRKATKEHLLGECVRAGVHFCAGAATAVINGQGEEPSTVQLAGGGGRVSALVPVVAAGHYSRLVKYNSPGDDIVNSPGDHMTADWRALIADGGKQDGAGSPWGWQYRQGGAPGYQIAYGIEAETEGPHGFPVNEMVLMDWSGEHLRGHPKEAEWSKVPTFLYVMPTDETHVFLEETSLTSRPALTFEDCEDRLRVRLAHYGVKVKSVGEVERCVIPMGGPLPVLGQRTIAYGASTNLVHPATGYMMNRSVANSAKLAAAVVGALEAGKTVDEVTAAAWGAVWSPEALRIRDFQVFGMEVILNMDLDQCRQFFRTFFRAPASLVWRQYLAMQLTSRECLEFALGLFASCPPVIKLRFMVDGVTRDGVAVLRSLLGL